MLRHIRATHQGGIYLLLDLHPYLHPYLDNPLHVRLLKEIAQGYADLPRTLVLVSHGIEIPPELRHLSLRLALRLPDRRHIMGLIREEAKRWQEAEVERSFCPSRDAVDQLALNLPGVTESDARRLIRNAIRQDGAITREDVEAVKRAKCDLLSEVAGTEPLSVVMHDQLRSLRAWTLERTVQPHGPEDQGHPARSAAGQVSSGPGLGDDEGAPP